MVNEINIQKHSASRILLFGLILVSAGIKICPAIAQITNDNTLSTPTQVKEVNSGLDFNITKGTQVGNNLFHSFREFSVPRGGSANFLNLQSIENIISRVTGSSVSNIDGLITTNGTANLFLINPNGIIFDTNAALNINGSFIASTANSLKLSNGDEFSAINPTTPLLTISVPLGLQFNHTPQSIIIQSQSDQGLELQGAANTTLGLLGGQVISNFGNITVPDGRIELGSVGSNSFVSLTPTNQGFSFNYADINNYADIELNGSVLNVSGVGGGKIQIQGQTITLNQSYLLFAVNDLPTNPQNYTNEIGEIFLQGNQININESGIQTITFNKQTGADIKLAVNQFDIKNSFLLAETRNEGKDGGDLTITADATEGLYINNSTLQTITEAQGKGGDITLTANQINIQGLKTVVASETRNIGESGNLTITTDDLQVTDLSLVGTETSGIGKGGNVTVKTKNLTVNSGGQIAANTRANGTGGNLIINAVNSVDIAGEEEFQGNLFASRLALNTSGTGTPGRIDIDTEKLTIRDGGRISASKFFQLKEGIGGDIFIQATTAEFNGISNFNTPSGLFSQVIQDGIGGQIVFQGENLEIKNGAQISTTTFAQGNAGNISIKVDNFRIHGEDLNPLPTGLFAQVNDFATGKGGNIVVETNQLEMQGATALISATTFGNGEGGRVDIQTQDLLLANGSQIQSGTSGFAPGGEIKITANNTIELRGTSVFNQSPGGLFTSTQGDASAGHLDIKTKDLFILDGARISASSSGAGDGGNIIINSENEVNLIGTSANGEASSGFFVEGTGTGRGGNIELQSRFLLLDQKAEILADSYADDGGEIYLNVNEILQIRRNSLISASAGSNSGQGNGGNINLNTTFIVTKSSENSDITANAFQGRGGNIQISAKALFGIRFRDELTPWSDITVSSVYGTSGVVTFNDINLKPIQGFTNTPRQFTNATQKVAQGCGTRNQTAGKFIVVGRGGLPAPPQSILSSDLILEDLATTPLSTTKKIISNTDDSTVNNSPEQPIVEAQGIVINSQGRVFLVAQDSTNTYPGSWLSSNCYAH